MNKFNSSDNSLSELLFERLVELIINREPFQRLNIFLSEHQLRIGKGTRQQLFALYKASKEKNLLDTIALSACIEKIDFQKAHNRYCDKKLKSKRKKKGPKKKVIKPYQSPPQVDIPAREKISQLKATVKIGLGLETNIKIPRVKSSEVTLDANTSSSEWRDKSILYVAGWSLKQSGEK